MKKFNSEKFGNALFAERKKQGIDLLHAASAVGISSATYHRCESGSMKPSIDVFYACCDWMQLPWQMDIFFTKEKIKQNENKKSV